MSSASTLLGIAGLGVVGKGILDSEEAKKEAKEEKKKNEANAARLEGEAKERVNIEDATQKRDASRRRQRQIAKGASGRSDTILTGKTSTTGGLGTTSGRKTLLGT